VISLSMQPIHISKHATSYFVSKTRFNLCSLIPPPIACSTTSLCVMILNRPHACLYYSTRRQTIILASIQSIAPSSYCLAHISSPPGCVPLSPLAPPSTGTSYKNRPLSQPLRCPQTRQGRQRNISSPQSMPCCCEKEYILAPPSEESRRQIHWFRPS
jgi:hypothetical protein